MFSTCIIWGDELACLNMRRDLDVPLALWPVDEIYLTMLKNLGKYIKGQDEWFFDEDD